MLIGTAGQGRAATDAGTRIVNVAGLQYEAQGQAARISSNTVTLTVAELLDVAITTPADTIAVARSQADVPVPFVLSNAGNAAETFAVAAQADRADTSVVGMAADTDDDGAYDPAVDQALAGREVPLGAGQRRRLFVLVRGAGSGDPTTVTATATAETGHGEPGQVFTAAGEGGGDAVVGRTGATAFAATRIVPGANGGPTLGKSQTVVAPDGSGQVVGGSTVTYRLDARFPGPIGGAEIVDAIPDGTRFVAGSITVDGRAVSDADDDDAGTFDGTAVRIRLGDIAGASTRSIQFAVHIQ